MCFVDLKMLYFYSTNIGNCIIKLLNKIMFLFYNLRFLAVDDAEAEARAAKRGEAPQN